MLTNVCKKLTLELVVSYKLTTVVQLKLE